MMEHHHPFNENSKTRQISVLHTVVWHGGAMRCWLRPSLWHQKIHWFEILTWFILYKVSHQKIERPTVNNNGWHAIPKFCQGLFFVVYLSRCSECQKHLGYSHSCQERVCRMRRKREHQINKKRRLLSPIHEMLLAPWHSSYSAMMILLWGEKANIQKNPFFILSLAISRLFDLIVVGGVTDSDAKTVRLGCWNEWKYVLGVRSKK